MFLHHTENMANAQVRLDFVKNQRGGMSLVIDGHKFVIKSRREERVYWTCSNRACPSRVTTREGILVRHNAHHIHEPDNFHIETDDVMQKMRKRCRKETTPIPTIYKEEVSALRNRDWNEQSVELVKRIKTFEGCKSQFYRERSKDRPVLPKRRQDIRLEGEWTETSAGEQFLLIDEGEENRMLVFATQTNLEHLCNARTIYADGTFYTCPGLFYQLYTWHCFIDGQMYPLMFAFLPGKSEETYLRLFNALDRECNRFGLELKPDILFMDHELAPRKAALRVFQTTDVKACFFHYTQCIWRKVQSSGLANDYRTNEDIHRLVRRAAVLPLVPVNSVEDVWFEALTDIATLELPAAVELFTDYVTENWIESDKQIWNHFNTHGPRTTNNVEGWHSMLKKAVQHSHPNIFSILRTIQEVESFSCIKVVQYATGGKRPTKRRKYKNIDTRLASLKERLRDGSISAIEYADRATYCLHM